MRRNALLSFLIFIIMLVKYILVNKFEIINPYARLSKSISWFVIFPLMLIGFFLSLRVIRDNYLRKINKNKPFIDLSLIIAMPMFIWFLYFCGMLVYISFLSFTDWFRIHKMQKPQINFAAFIFLIFFAWKFILSCASNHYS